MSRKRFKEEQIADFLRQAKEGMPDKALCEQYGFSITTLRRWKELHDGAIRNKLKKMESIAAVVYLAIIATSVLLAIVFDKVVGVLFIFLMLGYCVYYIVQFRKVSGLFISGDNVFLSRRGLGASNAFYLFSWIFVILFTLFIISSAAVGVFRG
ncbi:transposase [Leclercia adecarboxylata]|uniref:Transposase n=2 Tax=Leclercia TaxID=83654 RepID=A0ABS7RW98_9ENTR|nr:MULTISPECIES: transposase [Leclercia]MBZ0057694.1 transposase [Leclercia sp. EMC7]QCZ28766.1 transposase [Leclercia adecarboxylata]